MPVISATTLLSDTLRSQEHQHNLVERANEAALHENTMENLAPVRRPFRARPQHPRAEHASPELQASIAERRGAARIERRRQNIPRPHRGGRNDRLFVRNRPWQEG
jgi:hypothetical protein